MLLLQLQLTLPSKERYGIAGKILDSQGRPLAKAFVEVVGWQGDASGKIVRLFSDDQGLFEATGLEPGKYRVYAWKDSAGIPYARALLFQGSEQQYADATLTPTFKHSSIVLGLPAPYGVIKGQIRDSKTKQAVKAARVHLEREDEPGVFFETSAESDGTFVLHLPTKPIKLRIDSPGYTSWTYRDASGKDYIKISPGDELVIKIELN